MQLIVFVIASAMVLLGGVGVVFLRHSVHAALSLVLTLFGVAVHFVSMEAHFLAAVQVIVYAGAIVVLFLFVIMLLGVDRADTVEVDPLPIQRPLAGISALAIVGLVIAAIVGTSDAPPLRRGDGLDNRGDDSNIEQLAENLFGDHVLAFELTAVLLIVAVAGTVIMTRRLRRDPATDDGEES